MPAAADWRGVAKLRASPLTAHFAVVGLVQAGDDLDEGRFASTVLAQQGVDGA